jgi:hypothetical protein
MGNKYRYLDSSICQIKRADIRRAAYEDRAIAGLKDGYVHGERVFKLIQVPTGETS